MENPTKVPSWCYRDTNTDRSQFNALSTRVTALPPQLKDLDTGLGFAKYQGASKSSYVK